MTGDVQATEVRGRPRSTEADRSIMQATMKLLLERGFADTSIEAIAAESGVAKTTIYRRYRDKVDVTTAAIAGHLRVADVPDTGTLRGDLLAIMGGDALGLLSGLAGPLLGTLIAERDRNPELLNTFRERMIGPRRRQYHIIFERAAARGEVRPDVDHHVAANAMFGSMLARLVTGQEINHRAAEEAVDLVLQGITPRK